MVKRDIRDLYERGPARPRLRARDRFKIAAAIIVVGVLMCCMPLILFFVTVLVPAKMEVPSPSGVGSVICAHEQGSFQGSAVWFSVRDPRHSSATIAIGGPYESHGDVKAKETLWSGDGSVVAVNASVWQGSHNIYHDYFVAAYDFQTGQRILPSGDDRVRSEAVEALLKTRGGKGRVAIDLPYTI
jgi:hypothetical protein